VHSKEAITDLTAWAECCATVTVIQSNINGQFKRVANRTYCLCCSPALAISAQVEPQALAFLDAIDFQPIIYRFLGMEAECNPVSAV